MRYGLPERVYISAVLRNYPRGVVTNKYKFGNTYLVVTTILEYNSKLYRIFGITCYYHCAYIGSRANNRIDTQWPLFWLYKESARRLQSGAYFVARTAFRAYYTKKIPLHILLQRLNNVINMGPYSQPPPFI